MTHIQGSVAGSKEALEPCPFCGGADQIVIARTCDQRTPYNPADYAYPRVRCRCGVEIGGENWGELPTAIAAWNRRATTLPPGAEGELVGRLRGNEERLTPVDRLRLYATDNETFPLEVEDARDVVECIDAAADLITTLSTQRDEAIAESALARAEMLEQTEAHAREISMILADGRSRIEEIRLQLVQKMHEFEAAESSLAEAQLRIAGLEEESAGRLRLANDCAVAAASAEERAAEMESVLRRVLVLCEEGGDLFSEPGRPTLGAALRALSEMEAGK